AYSPEGVFMAKVGPTIGFETALRMKRVATAQWSIMQNQVTDLLARQANGYKDFYFPPELVTVAQDKRCACEECSSAVSPLAYLADLIGYATSKPGALKQVGTPKASLLPIYRLYNPSSGDHFYTQGAHEKDRTVSAGYQYEGIHFYLLPAAQDLVTPLYRLYHAPNQNEPYADHFYTTDWNERDNAIKNLRYSDEGNIGFIYEVAGNARDRIRLYRLLNDGSHDHFYTSDVEEANRAKTAGGYHREAGVEIAGYVPREAYDLVTIERLESWFYQPFRSLPTSCELMNERVRQVRICIEVLRAYAAAQKITLPPSFSKKEAQYRQDAYQALLLKLGTSYAGLRSSRGASQKDRESLATALGIPLGDGGQRDYLGELLLDIDTVTESDLERLFGLVDTTRDPLS